MPPNPAPNPSSGSDSGQDILARARDWIASVLNDIIRALADPEGAQVLLADCGWDGNVPALPTTLLDRLDREAQGSTGGSGGAAGTVAAVESVAEIVTAFGVLIEAMVAAGETPGGPSAAEVVADLFDYLMTLRMRRDHPGLWAILRLLNLIIDDAMFIAGLADLASGTHRYLTGLVTGPGYGQTYQDYSTAILGAVGTGLAFLPTYPKGAEHGPDQTSFRTEVLYGWTSASASDHPYLSQVLARTLTVRLDAQMTTGPGEQPAKGLEQTADLTFALVPPEHHQGNWGLFTRLSGTSALDIPFGDTGWRFSFKTTDIGAVEMLFGDHGFVRSNTAGFQASFAIERPDEIAGAWIIGARDQSHVEIQHARVALTFSSDGNSATLDIGAHTDHLIVEIKLGGDSFLSNVLPPSLRMDSKLGFGVDTKHGFYLDGGVALVLDMPVHIVIGSANSFAVTVQGLHLRLGLAGADPNAGAASGGKLEASLLVDASVNIAGGAFVATVAGIGVKFALTKNDHPDKSSGGAGGWQPALDFVPPNGLGIVVKAGPVAGGGFIAHDPDRGEYTGALQLSIHLAVVKVDITALGMLSTKIEGHEGDWALLLILAATWEPGLQLAFGIELNGLGGLVGINHALNSDAIADGLRTKALDSILFPPDPVAQAPHIFTVLRQTLPVKDGSMVVGPMFRLGWGGSARLVTLEIAVLFEFGSGPFNVVFLGSFLLDAPRLPTPALPSLVHLRADLIGVIDSDGLRVVASLVDSKMAGLTISGGLALVIRGGSDAAFALSIGGFNPHFTPPRGIPVVDRIRVQISDIPNPRLRIEAYFALTSQTVQFGARVELHASAGPLALDGWLGLDALIAWLPHFRFSVEIRAGVSLSYDGDPILEVSLDVLLEGPGPWHIKGYASLTILFITLSLPIDHTWGEQEAPTADVVKPLKLVSDELSKPGSWSAALPDGVNGMVALRTASGPEIPAHPLATVSCRQRIVPLGLSVTHMGNQPVSAPTVVDITALLLNDTAAAHTDPVVESFAAGQFLSLSDDQALSRPSFEPLPAGVASASDAVDLGDTTVASIAYKTIAVDGATKVARPGQWPLDEVHALALLQPDAPTLGRALPETFSVVSDTLRAATPGGRMLSSALAVQAAETSRLFDLGGIAR